jgi:hypothetical protein
MYAGLDLLKPLITASARADDYLGIVVIGTAQGDLHDIGKILVAMMLEGPASRSSTSVATSRPRYSSTRRRAQRQHRRHLSPR